MNIGEKKHTCLTDDGEPLSGSSRRSDAPQPATIHRATRTVDLVNTLFVNMADDKKEPEEEEELLDYEEEEEAPADAGAKGLSLIHI